MRRPNEPAYCAVIEDFSYKLQTDACAVGRKHPIRAFEVSIEFGNLVSGLYDDGPAPTCRPDY